MTINILGIGMPKDFPDVPYSEIHKTVSAYNDSHFALWREWGAAWNGLVYRYSFCCECSQLYTNSVKMHGDSPKPDERYKQEKFIFNFFVSGFSAIECFCYALFAIASIGDNKNFPLFTDDNKKQMTYIRLLEKFEKHFQNEDITKTLRQIIDSKEFNEWSDIRNVLTHRATPEQSWRRGGDRDGQTEWGKIDLNERTTTTRLLWLSQTVNLLVNDANKFVKKKLNR